MADENTEQNTDVEAEIKAMEAILNPPEDKADDLAGLDDDSFTAEEREAMAETDDDDDGVDPDEPFDDTTGEDAAAQESSDPDPDTKSEAEPEPQPDTVIVAEEYQIPDDVLIGDNLQTKLDEIKAGTDSLFDKYDDGEIDRAEMQAEVDKLNTEATRLQSEAERHIGIQAHSQEQLDKQFQTEVDVWNGDVKTYLDANPDLAEDANMAAYDELVKSVARMAAFKDATNEGILSAAHDMLIGQASALGLTVKVRVVKDPAPDDVPAPKKDKLEPKSGQPDIPVTIAKVPSAQVTDTGGKYAVLDDIIAEGDPHKIEEAMSRLTPEQEEEYGAS